VTLEEIEAEIDAAIAAKRAERSARACTTPLRLSNVPPLAPRLSNTSKMHVPRQSAGETSLPHTTHHVVRDNLWSAGVTPTTPSVLDCTTGTVLAPDPSLDPTGVSVGSSVLKRPYSASGRNFALQLLARLFYWTPLH